MESLQFNSDDFFESDAFLTPEPHASIAALVDAGMLDARFLHTSPEEICGFAWRSVRTAIARARGAHAHALANSSASSTPNESSHVTHTKNTAYIAHSLHWELCSSGDAAAGGVDADHGARAGAGVDIAVAPEQEASLYLDLLQHLAAVSAASTSAQAATAGELESEAIPWLLWSHCARQLSLSWYSYPQDLYSMVVLSTLTLLSCEVETQPGIEPGSAALSRRISVFVGARRAAAASPRAEWLSCWLHGHGSSSGGGGSGAYPGSNALSTGLGRTQLLLHLAETSFASVLVSILSALEEAWEDDAQPSPLHGKSAAATCAWAAHAAGHILRCTEARSAFMLAAQRGDQDAAVGNGNNDREENANDSYARGDSNHGCAAATAAKVRQHDSVPQSHSQLSQPALPLRWADVRLSSMFEQSCFTSTRPETVEDQDAHVGAAAIDGANIDQADAMESQSDDDESVYAAVEATPARSVNAIRDCVLHVAIPGYNGLLRRTMRVRDRVTDHLTKCSNGDTRHQPSIDARGQHADVDKLASALIHAAATSAAIAYRTAAVMMADCNAMQAHDRSRICAMDSALSLAHSMCVAVHDAIAGNMGAMLSVHTSSSVLCTDSEGDCDISSLHCSGSKAASIAEGGVLFVFVRRWRLTLECLSSGTAKAFPELALTHGLCALMRLNAALVGNLLPTTNAMSATSKTAGDGGKDVPTACMLKCFWCELVACVRLALARVEAHSHCPPSVGGKTDGMGGAQAVAKSQCAQHQQAQEPHLSFQDRECHLLLQIVRAVARAFSEPNVVMCLAELSMPQMLHETSMALTILRILRHWRCNQNNVQSVDVAKQCHNPAALFTSMHSAGSSGTVILIDALVELAATTAGSAAIASLQRDDAVELFSLVEQRSAARLEMVLRSDFGEESVGSSTSLGCASTEFDSIALEASMRVVELAQGFTRPTSAALRLALATLDGGLAWPYLAEALASVCAGGRTCRRSCGRHCNASRAGSYSPGSDCVFACGTDLSVDAARFDEPLASSPLATAVELVTAAMAAPSGADQVWATLCVARRSGCDLNGWVDRAAGPRLADVPVRVVLGGRFAPCAHGLPNEDMYALGLHVMLPLFADIDFAVAVECYSWQEQKQSHVEQLRASGTTAQPNTIGSGLLAQLLSDSVSADTDTGVHVVSACDATLRTAGRLLAWHVDTAEEAQPQVRMQEREQRALVPGEASWIEYFVAKGTRSNVVAEALPSYKDGSMRQVTSLEAAWLTWVSVDTGDDAEIDGATADHAHRNDVKHTSDDSQIRDEHRCCHAEAIRRAAAWVESQCSSEAGLPAESLLSPPRPPSGSASTVGALARPHPARIVERDQTPALVTDHGLRSQAATKHGCSQARGQSLGGGLEHELDCVAQRRLLHLQWTEPSGHGLPRTNWAAVAIIAAVGHSRFETLLHGCESVQRLCRSGSSDSRASCNDSNGSSAIDNTASSWTDLQQLSLLVEAYAELDDGNGCETGPVVGVAIRSARLPLASILQLWSRRCFMGLLQWSQIRRYLTCCVCVPCNEDSRHWRAIFMLGVLRWGCMVREECMSTKDEAAHGLGDEQPSLLLRLLDPLTFRNFCADLKWMREMRGKMGAAKPLSFQ